MKTFIVAIRAAVGTLLLTGLCYPLAMTGASRLLFPARADGSLVEGERGRVVGSELLAQPFRSPAYFQPRPSAAGAGYDARASGGSNLGPTSRRLRERATVEVERLQRENPDAPRPIPVELIAASASGLDPHLSPAAALWQVGRVARARNVDPERVRRLVERSVGGRDLGLFGEPRVNVLLLNLALDRQFGPALAPERGAPR